MAKIGRPAGTRRPISERFNKKWLIDENTGCWNWIASVDEHGYAQILTYYGDYKRPIHASRIAWELFKGKIPDRLFVLHKCDNPKCVNPKHLFLGTQKDNIQDAVHKNRMPKGEKHYRAKLTDLDIKQIRSSKMSTYALAKIFSVNQSTIFRIKNNKSRTNVP